MPITPAHPALAIHFRKIGLPLSALVIGSMIPDFEFFIRFSPSRFIGHSFAGVFLFCLPVGLATLWLFHRVVKEPAIALLPHAWGKKLHSERAYFTFRPTARFLRILLALFIGTLTHLGWDAFTHPGSSVVRLFPLLSKPIFYFMEKPVPCYFFLQYLSSALAILLLIVWVRKWASQISGKPRSHAIFSRGWKTSIHVTMGTLCLLGGILLGIQADAAAGQQSDSATVFISHASVGMVSFFLLILFLFSLVWHLGLKKVIRSSSESF